MRSILFYASLFLLLISTDVQAQKKSLSDEQLLKGASTRHHPPVAAGIGLDR